jgi:hypothetical protein
VRRVARRHRLTAAAVSAAAPPRSWPVRVLAPLLFAIAVAGCGGAYRDYPRWTLADATPRRVDCVEAQAFVRVSGKTGVGVTLALRSRGDCVVRIARAELVVGDTRFPAELPAAQTLPGRSLVYLWLPFPFDNEALWNDGRRRGQFELALDVNGVTGAPWIIPATHDFVGGRWKPESRSDR